MAFLYQAAGVLLFLSTTIKFWYLSKVSVLAVSFLKPKWCYQMEYAILYGNSIYAILSKYTMWFKGYELFSLNMISRTGTQP